MNAMKQTHEKENNGCGMSNVYLRIQKDFSWSINLRFFRVPRGVIYEMRVVMRFSEWGPHKWSLRGERWTWKGKKFPSFLYLLLHYPSARSVSFIISFPAPGTMASM